MRIVRRDDRVDVVDVPLPADSDVQLTLHDIRPWRDTLRVVAVLGDAPFDPATDAGDGVLFVYGAGDRAPGEPQEHEFDGIVDLHTGSSPVDAVRLYVTDIDGVVVDPQLLQLDDVAVSPGR